MTLYGCKSCPSDPSANKFGRLPKKGAISINWRNSLEYHVEQVHPGVDVWKALQVKIKSGRYKRVQTESEDKENGDQSSSAENNTIIVRAPSNTVRREVFSDGSVTDTRPRKQAKHSKTNTSSAVDTFETRAASKGRNRSRADAARASLAQLTYAATFFLSATSGTPQVKDAGQVALTSTKPGSTNDILPDIRYTFEPFDTEA